MDPMVLPPAASPTASTTPTDTAFSDQVVANTVAAAASQTPAEPTTAGRNKERVAPNSENISSSTTDNEPIKELEPEVEKVAEMMEREQIAVPAETVVADQPAAAPLPPTITQPVVVLPLNEQKVRQARRRGLHFSIRWLYEWCMRQMKKFRRQTNTVVVYREK